MASLSGWKYITTFIAMVILTSCSSTTNVNDTPKNRQAAIYNNQLGIAYLQQGDIPRAKTKLLLAEKQDPSSADILSALGYFYETTGDTVQAEYYYRKAIKIHPRAGSALNNYGAYLCKQKKYAQSMSYFVAATKDKNYTNNAATYENAGLCAQQIPDQAAAEYYFTKALQNNPELSTSNIELAQIYFNNTKFDLAEYYLQRYNKLAKPRAESLCLDMRLAKKANDKQRFAHDVAQLRENFPQSRACVLNSPA